MKVVILAGGLGTRFSEETDFKPKPMIEMGGKPILWHIMKIYSYYGFNEFIICLGYKGYMIKEYFSNYFLHQSDVTINIDGDKKEIHSSRAENWKITLVDTGLNTMTGGRIKKIQKYEYFIYKIQEKIWHSIEFSYIVIRKLLRKININLEKVNV